MVIEKDCIIHGENELPNGNECQEAKMDGMEWLMIPNGEAHRECICRPEDEAEGRVRQRNSCNAEEWERHLHLRGADATTEDTKEIMLAHEGAGCSLLIFSEFFSS